MYNALYIVPVATLVLGGFFIFDSQAHIIAKIIVVILLLLSFVFKFAIPQLGLTALIIQALLSVSLAIYFRFQGWPL